MIESFIKTLNEKFPRGQFHEWHVEQYDNHRIMIWGKDAPNIKLYPIPKVDYDRYGNPAVTVEWKVDPEHNTTEEMNTTVFKYAVEVFGMEGC